MGNIIFYGCWRIIIIIKMERDSGANSPPIGPEINENTQLSTSNSQLKNSAQDKHSPATTIQMSSEHDRTDSSRTDPDSGNHLQISTQEAEKTLNAVQ